MHSDASERAGEEPGLPNPERRSLLTAITLGIAGLTAAAVGIPFVAFFLSPFRQRPQVAWRPVGRLDDFPRGETVKVTFLDPDPRPWAGASAASAAWLRHDTDGSLVAFSAFCTPVGCPVRWIAGAGLFLCPCHGGAFDRNGDVAAGPPPRPLDRYEVRVRQGLVELRAEGLPLPGKVG